MKLLVLGVIAVVGGCDGARSQRPLDGPLAIDAPADMPPQVPVCGDGVIDDVLGEECDDGNTALADGCEACKWAYACVVTHGGGDPATISSMLVDTNGNLFDTFTLSLGVSDDVVPGQAPLGSSPIAACGRHVYAVAGAAEVIVSIEADLLGLPTLGGTTPVPDVHAVVCDGARSLLYALSASVTSPSSTVRTYAVAANGALTAVGTEELAFGATGGIVALHASLHPTTRDLWVFGVTQPVGPGPGGAQGRAARIATTAGGAITVAEAPRDIGLADLAQETVIRGDGTQLVMTGHGGGCTAVWQLPATGALPATADQTVACGGNFANGTRVAVRATSDLHFATSDGGALRVVELDPATPALLDRGTRTIATGIGPIELALAYDKFLVAFASATGTVTSFAIGTDETMLTAPQFPTVTIPAGHIRGSVVIPCARPIPI